MPDSDLGKIRKTIPKLTWNFADQLVKIARMPQTTATRKQTRDKDETR